MPAAVQLVAREGQYATLRLRSGEVRKVQIECMATIGQVGNLDHENESLGKAGRKRWMGKRPHNRGVTMNPVDHPMGGGEGKTSGGRHPVSPWGQVEVDGKPVGTTPPLNEVTLSEGRHTVTIRNDEFPPFTATINVVGGQPVNVKHRFGS